VEIEAYPKSFVAGFKYKTSFFGNKPRRIRKISNVSASTADAIFKCNVFGWVRNINLAVRGKWEVMV
jgi:hypothetical protein